VILPATLPPPKDRAGYNRYPRYAGQVRQEGWSDRQLTGGGNLVTANEIQRVTTIAAAAW